MMYRWKLVEGRDRSNELGRTDFEIELGIYKMALMRIMNKLLWGIRKTVIAESGFYVLKGYIGMYGRGVYGSAVTKNIIYCTAGIYGDKINAHTKNKIK